MLILAYANRSPHQQRWCRAFLDGLKRHGVEADLIEDGQPRPCDLAVFWSHKKYPVINAQKAAGRDYLVLEHGYVGDRINEYASAGYNGLNGHADFVNDNCGSMRWEQHFASYMKPWRERGEYIVIMGQVPGDQSIKDHDFHGWVIETARQLRKQQDLPVYFRPHPLVQGMRVGDLENIGGEFDQVLAKADGVVSFNSNSGVLAALAGVRVMACDAGSMARPVATHSPAESFKRLPREQWAWNLAWAQWTESEMRNGATWEHLKRKYER